MVELSPVTLFSITAFVLLMTVLFLRFRRPLYKFKCQYSLIKLSQGVSEHLYLAASHQSLQKVIVVIISGNPGFIRFYDRFASELQSQISFPIEIFGVGHLGQFNYPYKPLHNHFTLQDQVIHKAEFIKELIAQYPTAKFLLISHSIGTYMALNILDDLPKDKILKSIMLYPVIERINETPNGRFHKNHPYTPYIHLSSTLVGMIGQLPMFLKRAFLVKFLKKDMGEVKEDINDIAEVSAQYIAYSNFYSMLYMTRTEFTTLHDRQNYLLVKHASKLFMYYGKNDGWCPENLYNDMKLERPEIEAQIDQAGLPHAFVIGGAKKQVEIISSHIKKLLQ